MPECGLRGCNQSARWIVGFLLFATETGKAAEYLSGLAVCEAHRHQTFDWLLSGNWPRVLLKFQQEQMPPPVQSLSRTIFLPLV